MSSQIARSSSRSTSSRRSIFRAASALLRIDASGWFNWCAIDADSWPSSETRVMCRSAVRSCSASSSATLRCVMSIATPRSRPPSGSARPRAANHRTWFALHHAILDVQFLVVLHGVAHRALQHLAIGRMRDLEHLVEVDGRRFLRQRRMRNACGAIGGAVHFARPARRSRPSCSAARCERPTPSAARSLRAPPRCDAAGAFHTAAPRSDRSATASRRAQSAPHDRTLPRTSAP